jgi:hypothetical protein
VAEDRAFRDPVEAWINHHIPANWTATHQAGLAHRHQLFKSCVATDVVDLELEARRIARACLQFGHILTKAGLVFVTAEMAPAVPAGSIGIA